MKKRAKWLFGNQGRQFRRLANDRKPVRFANFPPFLAAFRFSAQLDRLGRGSQTRQQFANPASHLLRGGHPLLVFPRTQFRFDHRTRQNHLIVGNRHDQAPALKLLWSTQARFFPQQRLFVKAIAVFLSMTAMEAASLSPMSKGGVKVAVISRKGAVEQWKVPPSALNCELNLFGLFFPLCLVLSCKFAN